MATEPRWRSNAPARHELLPTHSIVICILMLLGAFGVQAAEDLTRYLPAEVETAIYIRDVPGMIQKLRDSPFRKVYGDSRKGDLFRPFRSLFENQSPELKTILQTPYDPALDIFNGGILIAKFPKPEVKGEKKRREGNYLILYEHRPEGDGVKQFQDTGAQSGTTAHSIPATAGGLTYQRIISTREIEIDSPQRKKNKKGRSGLVEDLASLPGVKKSKRQITSEEQLYVGPSLVIRGIGEGAPMAEAMKRLNPAKPLDSLVESEKRKGALAGLSKTADLELYYDFQQLSEGGKPLIDESLLGRRGNVRQLGVEEIKSAVVALDLSPDRMTTEISVFAPEPRKGMGKLLFINQPLLAGSDALTTGALTKLIPGDALGYSVFESDLPTIWREFRKMFQQGAPSLLQLVDTYLESLQKGMDEEIVGGLMDNLGSRWIMFTRYGSVRDRRNKKRLDTTYMIQLREGNKIRPTLERWLNKTASLMNYRLEQSEVGSRTFYRFAGAEVSEGALVKMDQVAKICLADRWLILSPRFEHIEAALKRWDQSADATEKIADDDRERRYAIAMLPPDRFFELYSASDSFGAMMDDPFFGLFRSMLGAIEDSILATQRGSDHDAWSDSFGPTCAAMRTDKDRLMAQFHFLYAGRKP